MNPIDILLIVLLAAALLLAVRKVIRDKKHGRSCCGSCDACCGCRKKRK